MSLFAVICQSMEIQRSHTFFDGISDTDDDELPWSLIMFCLDVLPPTNLSFFTKQFQS